MLHLSFKQTKSELMVRAASTAIFSALEREGTEGLSLKALTEQPQYGFTASAVTQPVGPKFVRITDLQDGKIEWNAVPHCVSDDPDRYALREGDILFARTGATTGKTHFIKSAPPSAIFASYLIRLRPKAGIEAGYLHAFFQSDNYWKQILAEKEGSAQPNVNGEKLRALRIPSVNQGVQSSVASFIDSIRRRQDGELIELPELPSFLAPQKEVVLHLEQVIQQINDISTLQEQQEREIQEMLVAAFWKIAGNAQTLPMRNVAPLTRRPVVVDPDKTYPQVSCRSFGRGTFHKPPLSGRDITWQKPFLVKSGDILISNIKAWEGAIAVATPEDDGRFGSHRYLTCVPDQGLANGRFVCFYLLTPQGLHDVGQASPGSADRNRTLSPKALMNVPIPMPPLEKQQWFEELFTQAICFRTLRSDSEKELNALIPSILSKALDGRI
jgi:type I restriction enzyme S subunit